MCQYTLGISSFTREPVEHIAIDVTDHIVEESGYYLRPTISSKEIETNKNVIFIKVSDHGYCIVVQQVPLVSCQHRY